MNLRVLKTISSLSDGETRETNIKVQLKTKKFVYLKNK